MFSSSGCKNKNKLWKHFKMKNLFSISKTYKAKHKTKSQHLWSVSRKNFYKQFLGIPLATFGAILWMFQTRKCINQIVSIQQQKNPTVRKCLDPFLIPFMCQGRGDGQIDRYMYIYALIDIIEWRILNRMNMDW